MLNQALKGMLLISLHNEGVIVTNLNWFCANEGRDVGFHCAHASWYYNILRMIESEFNRKKSNSSIK